MKTALATAAAALVLLAGCTTTDAGTTSPSSAGATGAASGTAITTPAASATTTTAASATTTPAASATTTTAASGTTTTGSGPSTTTADAAPTSMPTTYTDVNQTISDPDLKETVAVKRIARQLPWPAGYKASAQAYELLAVEMTWTPSKDFTIPIRWFDFSINSGSQFPNKPDGLVNDAVTGAGWTLLPGSVTTGDAVTGWLVFKVDPRNAPKLTLDYNRPATQVTGGAEYPAKTFSVPLVG